MHQHFPQDGMANWQGEEFNANLMPPDAMQEHLYPNEQNQDFSYNYNGGAYGTEHGYDPSYYHQEIPPHVDASMQQHYDPEQAMGTDATG